MTPFNCHLKIARVFDGPAICIFANCTIEQIVLEVLITKNGSL